VNLFHNIALPCGEGYLAEIFAILGAIHLFLQLLCFSLAIDGKSGVLQLEAFSNACGWNILGHLGF
jgi:hypothetical protein